VPFKHHAEHRHHIPKPRYRVTNWREYDAALRRRGSLTVWFTDDAIAAWRAEPRTTPGGQPYYSALAITAALTLRAVFHLALRQTEGLIGSVITLLGLALRFCQRSGHLVDSIDAHDFQFMSSCRFQNVQRSEATGQKAMAAGVRRKVSAVA
jgi:hypothetical protein